MNSPEDRLCAPSRKLYEAVKDLPIVSPHGHCDPAWWATDAAFPNPAELLILPDHYVFRMLYSQGVPLADLGLGVPRDQRNPRQIFQTLADHWHCFLGTPTREWMDYTLTQTLGIDTPLTPKNASDLYGQLAAKIAEPSFRPRALFDSFGIELLATTDAATDTLPHHKTIENSGWSGRVIPTFRPDAVLNPAHPGFASEVRALGAMTHQDTNSYAGHIAALRQRRTAFQAAGATATDHAVTTLATTWLPRSTIEALHSKAIAGTLTPSEDTAYYGHMLVEMAQMSADDGLVMQLHVGSRRNTNDAIFAAHGPDMGADMPTTVDWVGGLDTLLNRVGNDPRFRLLAFTLDEGNYARELAPMAGHWPCLRIGPPWWFHDSVNGMRRYLDQVVETAGYFNLAGFNDDTRAFLSIPARHNTWRRAVALHLADQVAQGRFAQTDAEYLAPLLCRDLALDAYRLDQGSRP